MTTKERAEDTLIRLQRNSVEARQIGIIRKAIEAAEEEATKKERARCVELAKRCAEMYQRFSWEEEEKARNFYGPLKPYPMFHLSEYGRMFYERVVGYEYIELVVREWNLNSNMMPMPF